MTATYIDQESSSAGGETPREHIMLRPQDYIGSVESCTRKMWVADDGLYMTHRTVAYVPGLYKIFDEVLVFAADNKRRDPSMDSLRVEVDAHQGRISIYYNGQGVPIELHPEVEGLHVPEMIFGGHLSSGDGRLSDGEEISGLCEEQSGGRNNSYGVKLANLFSTEFVIEIVDSHLEKKYKQIFYENMGKKSEPQVTVCLQGVNWTRITFKPDLAKFHMTHLDDDVIDLMRRRVIDMAAFLGITVVFNGRGFRPFTSFGSYVSSYIRSASREREESLPCVYEKVNSNLEVCVTRSQGTFEQVSFVNKYATTEGGTHVDFVVDQIAYRVAKCSWFQVEECDVKKHLFVFVNVVMENPSFNSPLRDALTSPQESFGSSCEFSDDFIAAVFGCVCSKLRKDSSKGTKASKRRASATLRTLALRHQA